MDDITSVVQYKFNIATIRGYYTLFPPFSHHDMRVWYSTLCPILFRYRNFHSSQTDKTKLQMNILIYITLYLSFLILVLLTTVSWTKLYCYGSIKMQLTFHICFKVMHTCIFVNTSCLFKAFFLNGKLLYTRCVQVICPEICYSVLVMVYNLTNFYLIEFFH